MKIFFILNFHGPSYKLVIYHGVTIGAQEKSKHIDLFDEKASYDLNFFAEFLKDLLEMLNPSHYNVFNW